MLHKILAEATKVFFVLEDKGFRGLFCRKLKKGGRKDAEKVSRFLGSVVVRFIPFNGHGPFCVAFAFRQYCYAR